MGPNPVALTDIATYWNHVGRIGPMDEFIAVVQAMDAVYLTDQSEKAKAKQGK